MISQEIIRQFFSKQETLPGYQKLFRPLHKKIFKLV